MSSTLDPEAPSPSANSIPISITEENNRISAIILKTIGFEGGFVINKNDKGGATNFGITLYMYQRCVNIKATTDDLQRITKEQAVDFYRRFYFEQNHIERFPVPIQDIIFDMCVMYIPHTWIGIVQTALCVCKQKVKLDGILGDATFTACFKVSDMLQFRNVISSLREGHADHLVQMDPTQESFLQGWINRINAYRKISN